MIRRLAAGHSTALAYGLAAAGVAAVTVLRLPLEGFLHGRTPYTFYYLPILLSAWYGGIGPTLLAIALSLASAWLFFVPAAEPGSAAALGVFLFVAGAMVMLARAARNTRTAKRAQRAAQGALLAARREAEARAFLASIVESSDDAIIAKDLTGIIRACNPAAEKLFGYTSDELIGQPVAILVPPDRQEEEEEILGRLRRGQRIDHYETIRLARDGRLIDISLTISPLRDSSGTIIGASKIGRDISDRKRTAALGAAVTERERLLEGERSARAEAEQASRSKDEFVATMSHELRTPLNAILGWAQLLAACPGDENRVKQGLEIIERNTRLQAQLISDLLDVSRIVSGKLRLEEQSLDFVAVVDHALETLRPAADAKGITLERTVELSPAIMRGDDARLQQCVWNLLTNAIKFTPKGGRVSIAVRRAGGHAELAVSDTGIGIEPEFLPLVFERFRQHETRTTRHFGGLGLGLAIVKQLVELHGGSVRAESEGRGTGATFTLSLPLAGEGSRGGAENPTSAMALDGDSLDGMTVLVVEDDADTRELVRRLLEGQRARVLTAGSANEALEVLAADRPDILVSDIGLPGMDGYELVRRLREMEGGRASMPAIALTAYARSEDRTKAFRTGFQAHVTKPMEPAELIATVASFVDLIRGPRPA